MLLSAPNQSIILVHWYVEKLLFSIFCAANVRSFSESHANTDIPISKCSDTANDWIVVIQAWKNSFATATQLCHCLSNTNWGKHYAHGSAELLNIVSISLLGRWTVLFGEWTSNMLSLQIITEENVSCNNHC